MPVELEMPRLPLEPVSVCKGGEGSFGVFDVRLSLKGKNGGSVVLELNSEVLSGSSYVFADLIAKYRAGCEGGGGNFCRIEVPEVENLSVFQMTIELMFEEDMIKRLMKIGVYRSVDILEVLCYSSYLLVVEFDIIEVECYSSYLLVIEFEFACIYCDCLLKFKACVNCYVVISFPFYM